MAAVRCLLSVLVLLAAAVSATHAEAVVTLESSTFDAFIKDKDFVVVEFYAPWCGHCKSLAPEYEKAAQQLKAESSPIILAKVDADAAVNKMLAKKFDVKGYPTLKIFRNGQVAGDYNGPREADGIVKHVKKISGPAAEEIKSAEDLEKLKNVEKVVVVGLFDKFEGEEFEVFKKQAEAHREDFAFRYTDSAAVLGEPGVAAPAVRLFKDFDDGVANLAKESFTEEGFTSFLDKESVPLVVNFSPDPADQPFIQKVFSLPTAKAMLFLPYTNKDLEAFRSQLTTEAKVARPNLHYLIGDADKAEQALKYFSLEVTDTPAIVIHDPSADAKYVKKNVKAEEITAWLDEYAAGTMSPHVKSEPIPEKNDGPVTVLVGHTFNDLVINSNKNVLIEFYAEWCGHCKKLVPVYEEVGRAFATDDSVVVAKMDYTQNDLVLDPATKQKFSVSGFPTIYLYTTHKQSIKYEGDRSKQSLIDFVKEHKTEGPAPAGGDDEDDDDDEDVKDEL